MHKKTWDEFTSNLGNFAGTFCRSLIIGMGAACGVIIVVRSFSRQAELKSRINA